jgi:hypothetical protein
VSGLNETISPESVSSTILVALANARRRGDPWKSAAEELLGPTEVLLKRTNESSMNTLRKLASAGINVEKANQKMQQLFETVTDALWESRGMMAQDPLMPILSDGTPSYFFDWTIGQSSDRVETIIEFLTAYIPSDGPAKDAVVEIRSMLPEYRAECESMRVLRCTISIYEKMFEIFTRNGHVQYSRLRRRMRADGFDAFEIRSVFPDITGNSATGTLN